MESKYTRYCAIIVICLILVLIKHWPMTSRTQRGTDFRFKGDTIRGGRVLVQIRQFLQTLYNWETLTSCTNRDLCAFIGLSVPTPRAGLYAALRGYRDNPGTQISKISTCQRKVQEILKISTRDTDLLDICRCKLQIM